jgi:hypothetical protein
MVRIQISGIKNGSKYTCVPPSGGWRGSEMIASMAGGSMPVEDGTSYLNYLKLLQRT